MKKIIGFLIVLGVLVLGAPQAKAYTLDDLMAQITSLQQQVSGLQNEMSAVALKAITPTLVSTSIYPAGCNSYIGFSLTTGLPCFLQTNSATSITSTTAILNGKLFAGVPATISWNINPSSGMSNYITSTTGPLTANLAGLTPNTTYQFQVCSTSPQNNGGNVTCAGWLSFTTTKASIPVSPTIVKSTTTTSPALTKTPKIYKNTAYERYAGNEMKYFINKNKIELDKNIVFRESTKNILKPAKIRSLSKENFIVDPNIENVPVGEKFWIAYIGKDPNIGQLFAVASRTVTWQQGGNTVTAHCASGWLWCTKTEYLVTPNE